MKKTFFSHSIYKKYILLLLFLTMIPVLFFVALFLYLNQQNHSLDAYEVNDQVLESITNNIDNNITFTNRTTQSILSSSELISFLNNNYTLKEDYDNYMSSIQNYMQATINASPQSDIYIYMQNRSIPMSMDVFYHLSDIENLPPIADFLLSSSIDCWFSEADFSDLQNPFLFATDNRFIYIRKAYDSKRNFLGIIVYSIPENYVLSFDDSSNKMVLSDQQFRIVNLTSTSLDAETLTYIKASNETHYVLDSYLVAQKKLNNFPFTIVTVTEKSYNQQILIISACCIIVLALIFTVICLKNMNQLLEQMKATSNKESKLIALQHQINPHFIYNTMEVFSSRMKLYKHYEESDAMISFANIFRYNIATNDALVPLQEELIPLNNYMDIQKLRYPYLNLKTPIPEDLSKIFIPKFTLQPIVENAINHGIEESTIPLTITISAKKQAENIRIEIEDNGVGIPPEDLKLLNAFLDNNRQNIQSNGHGVGLKNVSTRLSLYYGKESRLHITSNPGVKTCVSFTIPQSH